MPQSRRSLFQTIAGAIGLVTVKPEIAASIPLDDFNPYIPQSYRDKLAKSWVTQTPLPAYPGSPANDALYSAMPSFRHGMSFGPDWLHESAAKARDRGENLEWCPQPATPLEFRDWKKRRQDQAYRRRIFNYHSPSLSAETYFRSKTLTDHLNDAVEAINS